jgi:DNA-directed RNA polymerase II subunit RPB11
MHRVSSHRELHKNPDVVFAGYKNPHPTDHRIVLKVHTNSNTTPVQALKEAVTNLRAEVSDLSQQFADEINAIRQTRE